MNEVLQQPDLGSHAWDPKEFQETIVSRSGNGARVIPGNNIFLFMLSFMPLQHHDGQMPAQEP
jgi:hypothetical protein